MKDIDTKELVHKHKVLHNLIVVQIQMAPTIENRFNQKKVIDSALELGKRLTEIEKELEERGVYLTR